MRRWGIVAAVAAVAAGLYVVASPPTQAAPDTFVRMPDGIELAVGIQYPEGYEAGKTYPTIFEMSGYDGASAQGATLAHDFGVPEQVPVPRSDSRQLTRIFEGEYVTVHVSVRGTGCSGGEFDLFNWQTAEDGKFLIDHWVVNQPWSNKKVAIVGHSYSGITGLMVAEAQPQHVVAVSVSGLIDDLYRGLVYPGGVPNYGFPLLWGGAIRPVYDVAGGLAPGLVRSPDEDDDSDRQEHCARAATTKNRTILNDAIVQGASSTDTSWFQVRSLITRIKDVTAPLHITGAYQDEQTGPRGPTHLWEKATNSPHRRLLLLNGDHDSQNPGATGPEVWQDRKSFVDAFTGVGGAKPAKTSVTVLWEYHRDSTGTLVSNGRTDAPTWPLPQTRFTDFWLQPDGSISPEEPTTAHEFPWVAGSPRQSWSYQAGPDAGPPLTTADAPDQVVFRSLPLTKPLAIHGPITATLDVAATTPDTDLFVQLVDEDEAGNRTHLQRGMLKASHRAIDTTRSDFTHGVLYRPWRPHSNPTPIMPGEVISYLVEVFPVGHVFRPGHRLVVLVHSPPLVDSYYAYVPTRAPAGVDLLHVGPGLSRITLPVVPAPTLGPEIACGGLEAVRCVPPASS